MPTWADVLVVTAMYLLCGGGTVLFLMAQTRGPKFRAPTVAYAPASFLTDSDHEGLI